MIDPKSNNKKGPSNDRPLDGTGYNPASPDGNSKITNLEYQKKGIDPKSLRIGNY